MAVTQAVCNSFKLECLQAIHDFANDTFKMALFDSVTATLDADTTAYSATGEITGTGYTAGGQALDLSSGYPQIVGNAAQVRFDDEAWTSATFTADSALIYNSSKANRAVCALYFGGYRSVTNGTFTVSVPTTVSPIIRLQ